MAVLDLHTLIIPNRLCDSEQCSGQDTAKFPNVGQVSRFLKNPAESHFSKGDRRSANETAMLIQMIKFLMPYQSVKAATWKSCKEIHFKGFNWNGRIAGIGAVCLVVGCG